ncbi:MBL fold metallo-hydrolase [Pseudomonas sp. RAC1]|uniref:MBL fold metallo-hydrolase n=1 Tax=Pseudomonas sp. RAC1 TaxID=3064900 RepID=UPI002727EC41|nr:MBL fold metallo-hydrolase [Pseudomonas sp. RAC1]MDV9033033.1 MBL fold metallo-hydrolase [Pseudomonas sp. RAC1]
MPSHIIDTSIELAKEVVHRAIQDPSLRPIVSSFFDERTFTATHIVRGLNGDACAVIDSVLDYDSASGATSDASAQQLVEFITVNQLRVEWLLETHVHADHFSAAPLLKASLGGKIAISEKISVVQKTFGHLFNAGLGFANDGSQFDHLFSDGEFFRIGKLEGVALHVPGHTPACMAYVIGDAVFVGDTLFMPDYGTARCDFPGGDSRTLYSSVQRILSLPEDTRVFICHDYKAPGRDEYLWECRILDQKTSNIHIREGINADSFVEMREKRDATLTTPKLMLPSVQINMCGGNLPAPEENGIRYLKIPLNSI